MEQYYEFLEKFLSFPSVSTDDKYQDDITELVTWLIDEFGDRGFEAEAVNGYGNPIVIASYEIDPELPTCLVYGHYDVQPADKSDGWKADPFELYEADNRIYARGAVDNKGQVAIHIVNVFEAIENDSLAYNLKFMIEGNEETGSPKMEDFLKDHKADLEADFSMISDGEISGDNPVVELGFRGGFNSTMTVRTSTTDLHSGIYGGAAPSAALEIVKLLDSLKSKDNYVQIDGFYDDVREVDAETKSNNEAIPFDFEEYKRISGTKALLMEEGMDFNTQVGLRPTLEITGIETGYTGKGYRNGIPAVATAKVNFRLVKDQVPSEIADKYREYLEQQVPEYVDFELDINDPYEGVKIDTDNEYVESAIETLEKAFGKKVLKKYSGGGLPIVTYFDEMFGIPQVIVPLANEDCAMHAPNENFDKSILEKGFEFSRNFFNK